MADYQQCTQAYDALMQEATRDAFGLFEDKLAECEEPGRQIQSARALFDLWADAAEDAYAKIALSHEFREVYGKLVDRSEEHTSELQSLMRISYAVFCLKKKTTNRDNPQRKPLTHTITRE